MVQKEFQLRMIAWEITRSCNLKCLHCRANAYGERDPEELSFEECKGVIDSIPHLSSPTIILTGGEPLLRDDLFDLIDYGGKKGLRMVLATNGTLLTREIVKNLKELGIRRVSLSIDGKDKDSHDGIRGVPYAFDSAIEAAKILKDEGMQFQINTTITSHNFDQIESIYELARSLGACAWHPFLLLPVGRGRDIYTGMAPHEYENLLLRIYELQKRNEIEIKVTCGPQYYRILKERGEEPQTSGCLAGKAFMFISNRGLAKPCGYLDLVSGNVRQDGVEKVWRDSEVFSMLRDFRKYKGRCGSCKFLRICGGCRARAQELLGDFLEEDPLCTIQ